MKKDIHIEIDTRQSLNPGYCINKQPGRAGIMIDARTERQAMLYLRAALAELDADAAAPPQIGGSFGRLELVK